ncbi:hypothetical protein OE88DRAFT_1656361 [Heliocybe sulcata]|uniref:F-box domain-containing protein n=1 Tax=Heliocybe sulcata TaxID=5364 RepID=A0A5C3NGW7_9AGAM|nr:hypothetical protein OE88DRAFT_1656361 [Heliocybe sulcata]
MGQYWTFVNIDQKEYWGGCKLGEMIPCGGMGDAIITLILPPDIDPDLFRIHANMLRRASRTHMNELGRLKLPIEILQMIFCEIDCLEDAASLCLANSMLWVTGWDRARELVTQHPARWEGQRMACIGDDTRDLPRGLLEPEEMKAFEGFRALPAMGDRLMDPNFYTFMCAHYTERERSSKRRAWSIFRHWEQNKAFDLLAYPGVLGFRQHTPPHSYIHDRRWILLNLSKKEYVRSSAVLSAVGDAIHLGDVLFSQICWSTERSISVCYEGDIHRGAWAGDRFSIKAIEDFEREDSKVKWTDVSDRVMKEVLAIWRAEYGQDWPAGAPEMEGNHDEDAYVLQENSEADSDGDEVQSEEEEPHSEDDEGHIEHNSAEKKGMEATEEVEED